MQEPLAFAAEKDSPAPAQQQPVQSGNPSVSAITQAAVKAGVLACASRINQVTNFLTAGSQWFGAFLIVPPANPDQQIVSASLEIQSKDAPLAYASASFAPNQANGCGGMYETVVYWAQGCDKVASQNFGGLKRIDTKQGAPSAHAPSIVTLDGGATTKIFLMPAGTGCVSIKKEVVQ
ncbi:MAG: hypothetical protein HZB54_02650 [Deltaproteobacteria bacterium]|nr:hypothetical protein [Deltaproteobacteria bacterium]